MTKRTVCLNMIVKNESKVIKSSFASVMPFINYWVIVDTGSTDTTKEIIREFQNEVPGELYERPWVDFAHNRNEAMQLAHNKADYLLFMDADDLLVALDNFELPNLDKDFYFITSVGQGTSCYKILLINNKLEWKWEGVLHEYLVCSNPDKTFDTLIGIKLHHNALAGGGRSLNKETSMHDVKTLTKALKKDPTNARYQFYLAHSYVNANKQQLALKEFQKRITMGGNAEEIFWSLYQIAILQEQLHMPPKKILEGYYKAHTYRPSRAEPLYYLARYYLRMRCYEMAYETAYKGLSLPPTNDQLYIHQWIYDYGLLVKFAECAFALHRYKEARSALVYLLSFSDIPPHVLKAIHKNLTLVNMADKSIRKN